MKTYLFGLGLLCGLCGHSLAGVNAGGTGYPVALGACCLPDCSCLVTTQADCTGTWMMDQSCTPNPCACPQGSCCAHDGTGTVTPQLQCNGTWTLFGTCVPNNCPQPEGSCCAQNGSCTVTERAQCAGIWTTDQTCVPDACSSNSSMESASRNLGIRNLLMTPNSSTGQTLIAYQLPNPAEVSIDIVDASGSVIRQVVGGCQGLGTHVVRWNGDSTAGSSVPSGVYWIRFRGGARLTSEKITLVR